MDTRPEKLLEEEFPKEECADVNSFVSELIVSQILDEIEPTRAQEKTIPRVLNGIL